MPRGRGVISVRVGGPLLGLALAALLLASCASGSSGSSGYFYDAPGAVPKRPGVLLRSQPLTAGTPPGGRAWRILYTTTRLDGRIALASAVVLAPARSLPGRRPVIAWAHGTTGVARGCAPSLLGGNYPFYAGIPAVEGVLQEGWVLIAPDYPGLGTAGPTPYLIGSGEARSVLDSVRAARKLAGLALSPRTVVWGHSQGGQAALWTGILAPRYAPDVTLSGVAAMAPVTAPGVPHAGSGNALTGVVLEAYLLDAYSRAYPDVRVGRYVQPGGAAVVNALAARCLEGSDPAVPYLRALPRQAPIFNPSPITGPWQRRLLQNIPAAAITAPVLIAQGLSDDLVHPTDQLRYVRERCAGGQSLEYRTYEGRSHTSLTEHDSPMIPDLFEWTQARFAGIAASSGCRFVQR